MSILVIGIIVFFALAAFSGFQREWEKGKIRDAELARIKREEASRKRAQS